MSLYDEIEKLLSKSGNLKFEVDNLCKQYNLSTERLYSMIETISYHKQLQNIDLNSNEKVYSNNLLESDLFLSYFETLLNSDEIKQILEIISDKEFNYDLNEIGINCSSWADTQLFIQSIILQKIYSFVVINHSSRNEGLTEDYLKEIIDICNSAKSFKEILTYCDSLLLNSLIDKSQIGVNITTEVLKKIGDAYIKEGYCFHGFNTFFEKNILRNGLSGRQNFCDVDMMMSLDTILERHKIHNSFQQNWDYQIYPNFFTTDNFAAAYYYSVLSPVFLSRLVSNGKYMLDETKYDRMAFFQRNSSVCLDNVDKLLSEYEVPTSDKQYIINYLNKILKEIFASKDILKIACFKRKNIKRDFSSNYDRAILSTDLPLKQLVLLSIKPDFEIDRHENTLYEPNVIQTIEIPNYAKSLIKKIKF